MNSNEQKTTNNSLISCSELAAIYTTTFQYTGMEFVDALLREITIQTRVQSTFLLQLLTSEEYKDISTIYNKKGEKSKFHVTSNTSLSPNSSPEIHHSEEPSPPRLSPTITKNSISDNHLQDHFLLIRSCFSTQANTKPRFTNTIIPLSCLNASSPFIKTLLNESKLTYVSNKQTENEKEEIERGIYPEYQEFVGLRLESFQKGNRLIQGILCVTDNTIIDTPRENMIKVVLEAVHTRCINELMELQRQEQLIIARDIAILDAENKLKFLADMSHEIRTPMNAVIALTDLLLQEKSTLNMEQIEHLEVIQTSGSHLLTIINDILDISKLNHDPKFKLESRRFSLRKCLKDTLNMARHQASMSQQNKVVYVLECPPDKDDNVPLPQLIQQLENDGVLLRPLLHKKGKTVLPVIWKIDADVPDHLVGDTMRLTQIMLNLCSNALKFTKQGGIHIRIKRSTPTPLRTPSQNKSSERRMTFKERYDAKIETMWNQAMQDKRDRSNSIISSPNNPTSSATATATSGGGLVASVDEMDGFDYFGEKSILEISVTDTGIGIPTDRLPKLFKSFSQIDISTARRYGGTGLGLAISSTLVNRMGGCLWVESEEGVGSRFALTLPMTVAPRGRNYSSDSTVLGYSGSPSSPSSTISDSSNSVHSTVGCNNSSGSDTISPASSMYNTFTTSVLNNTPGYFPLIASQPSPQRPILSRSSHQQLYTSDAFRSEPQLIPQMIQQNNNDHLYSPMAEDSQPLNQSTSTSTNNINIQNPEQLKRAIGGNSSQGNSNSNVASSRKVYSDLLSPATRNARVAITKQHYHNRKPQNKEENLAKSHPLRILLAEDNILNQKIAISILKRLGYVDVAIANNGSEVLTLMKTSVFDIIFMDLYMPEMDGLEVTREIIKERTRQKQMDMCLSTSNNEPTCSNEPVTLLNAVDVYIIALTASASREDRQICIDAGMNDFISKPFTMTEMKSALKTCATKRKKRRKLAQKPILNDNYHTADEEVGSPVLQAVTTDPGADDPMLDIQSAPAHLL